MRALTLILLLSMVYPAGEPQRSTALMSLVAAELTFARTCKQKGVRASFVEFFADDGIAFKPEPFCYKQAVKDRPPPANPMGLLLEWEPDIAGVSASGELGYTTGPSVRTDNTAKDKPKGYGQFFSVWKKQKDGAWKVAVDIGNDTPEPTASLGTPFQESTPGVSAPTMKEKSEHDRLSEVMDLDRKLSRLSVSGGVTTAYLSRINDDTRLHRENHMPIVGRDAVRAYLHNKSAVATWSPMAGDVSLADDLGYTYGSYSYNTGDSTVAEQGYYLHVWKRDSRNEWTLVADITNRKSTDKDK